MEGGPGSLRKHAMLTWGRMGVHASDFVEQLRVIDKEEHLRSSVIDEVCFK